MGAPLNLRPPEEVMRLARMGSFHPTRLSFLRVMLRMLGEWNWRVERTVWDIDDKGVGRAVYCARGPVRSYSLICYAHDLPDHLRSDRVIAEAWDATFALFDGEPTVADLDRLQGEVPLQEAGRMSVRELSLSRANRSVRLFEAVIAALADGRQPDREELARVGYLMRTTAVYGSAKFGSADREVIADRPEFSGPFRAEMLNVWLTRAFTIDIAEHLAAVRGGDRAVRLDRDLRRALGVGNATGLGMAPFLLNHPVLIHHWMAAREEALARVRAAVVTPGTRDAFLALIPRVRSYVDGWRTGHPLQLAKLVELKRDLATLADHVATAPPEGSDGWERLWTWAQGALGLEGQEQLFSLMLEPHGALVDDLADRMAADEAAAFRIDGAQTIADLRAFISKDYAWALDCDWSAPDETARLWYVSEEKLEPRLAERAEEPLEAYEQPLAPGRDVAALARGLDGWEGNAPVADFLRSHPEHRYAVRRCQIAARFAYAEVRDNTIAADMLPMDLLRAKLSFFGATRFDPRSDRWVRITLFQGAPYPDEPELWAEDDWMWRE